MINFFRKKRDEQRGATTLVIATMLLISATLVVMFGASYSIIQQRITSNYFRNAQAFEAAQAGLEYGIVFLQQNKDAITGSPSGGYIPSYTSSSTTNVVLANGSRFSVVYTNPVANNYNLIQVSSTGTSDDNTATRVVSQQVQFNSLLYDPGNRALVSKGNVFMFGNSVITNTAFTTTIQSGGSSTLYSGARTVLSTGTSSTAGNIKSDVSQNNTGLSSMSSSDFFARYFGAVSSLISNKFVTTYTSYSSTNYNNALNGISGTTVWINQLAGTAQISGSTVVGTITNPVLLVVNGDLDVSGSAIIYGFVFVVGASGAVTSISDNAIIVGNIVSGNTMATSDNAAITFNSSVQRAIQNLVSASYFAKVPGTWADF